MRRYAWTLSFLQAAILVTAAQLCNGEGTVYTHLHTFKMALGCPDYTLTNVLHTNSCEVYLRVCLQPNTKASTALCPISSYTTPRYPRIGGNNAISLSTAQPAKLYFNGSAQDYSILVEAWGHEEVPLSKFHILSTFVKGIPPSSGEWSSNEEYSSAFPSTLSMQWQVVCLSGRLPVGTCNRRCTPSTCVMCLQDGTRACRIGCDRQACLEEGVDNAEQPLWTNWGTWSECSSTCGRGTMSRSRTCAGGIVPIATRSGACSGAGEEATGCRIAPCPGDCGEEPCHNGGVCRRVTVQVESQSVHQDQCLCHGDYMGRYCDHKIQRSIVQKDASLPVTIAISLSVAAAAFILVAALCCCIRRCRTPTESAETKPPNGEQSTVTTMEKSPRFPSLRRTMERVSPGFGRRQSWSRKGSQLSVNKDEDVGVSSGSMESDTFQTPDSTLSRSQNLKSIDEGSETPPSTLPIRHGPSFFSRLTQRRALGHGAGDTEQNIYQDAIASPRVPGRTASAHTKSQHYEEVGDTDVYEDVAVVTSGAHASSGGGGRPNSLTRGLARFGMCIGAGMARPMGAPTPQGHSPFPDQFGPDAVQQGQHVDLEQSNSSGQLAAGRIPRPYEEPVGNISAQASGPRSSVLTWWSKHSSSSPGGSHPGKSQRAESVGSESHTSNNSAERIAFNPLYNQLQTRSSH